MQADRELPVVWAVAKGSALNKLILVPAALAISQWLPWAVTPLLMAGGLFLCFEGFEKLAHRMLHGPAERQAERRTIAALSGNTITLDRKLDYMHFGKITFDVDERGEVGLLTRNIRIQASEDAATSYFGGHVMAMAGSRMYDS